MYTRYLSSAIAVLAASQLAQAQTHTDCSPVKRDDCPDNPALGGTVEIDFAKGESKFFKSLSTPVIYSPTEGALFTIKTDQDSPTIEALKYIMFGRVDIKMQAAPGAGIVTSLVLESKDLDEIDLEWVGGNNGQVQSNYFSKGDTSTYDRGAVHAVSNPLGSSHVYSIDWTKDRIQWLIDGAVVRELTYAAAKGGSIYPQTPMRVKIGTWVAGRKGAPQGTIDWAGGLTDFSKGPFTAIYRSVKITDYTQGSAGQAYHYSDRSGTYQSIKVVPLTGSNNSEDDESSSSVTSSKPTSTTTSAAPSSTANNATTTMVTSTTSAPVTGQSSAPSQTPASNSAAQTQFANVALMAALGYLAYLAM